MSFLLHCSLGQCRVDIADTRCSREGDIHCVGSIRIDRCDGSHGVKLERDTRVVVGLIGSLIQSQLYTVSADVQFAGVVVIAVDPAVHILADAVLICGDNCLKYYCHRLAGVNGQRYRGAPSGV